MGVDELCAHRSWRTCVYYYSVTSICSEISNLLSLKAQFETNSMHIAKQACA